jgi:transposase InsO family protein
MPFREVSVMDQRREFVVFASFEGANVRELCRRFGISPTTGYAWLDRYREQGLAGLIEQSRRPKTSPRRTPVAVEAKVLALRDRSNNVWGGRKIRRALADRGAADIPAASTITQILRRHARLTEAGAAQHPGPWLRFERESPNELLQMDFKGHFTMHGGRCHPLTALDDHSRFNLVLAACPDEQGQTVRRHLEEAFRRYGLPLAMLMDGGSPWSDPGGEPLPGSASGSRGLAFAWRTAGRVIPRPRARKSASIGPSRRRWSAVAVSAISPSASAPSTTGAPSTTMSGRMKRSAWRRRRNATRRARGRSRGSAAGRIRPR